MTEIETNILSESKRLIRRLFTGTMVWTLLLSVPGGLTSPSAHAQTQQPKTSPGSTSSGAKKQAFSASPKKKQVKKRAPRGQREIESSRVIEIQNALAHAGFYKEQPSGSWDPSTTQAMSAYQESNGFKITGKPDALSLKKLGL